MAVISMYEDTEDVEILLIEDNPHDVELILHVFRWCNLPGKVLVVWDGEEALDYLSGRGRYAGRNLEKKPKLILLDMKLPKVGGVEVLKRIKGDPGLLTVPVVMLTSSNLERDISESYRLGVNSYIVKPVDFEEFADVIREMAMYWHLINQPSQEGS
jgi:two-component system, response regulator